MTTTTPKKFTRTVDGNPISYERRENGYCYCGTSRISAKRFEECERLALQEQRERNQQAADRLRAAIERNQRVADRLRAAIEYDERKADMNIIEIDGVEWAKDLEGNTYRDGERCGREEFNRALGINAGGRREGKAPRKAARPKDVAFEHGGVTLTAKQADFLRELAAAGRDGVLGDADAGWWCDLICDGIGGQFADKPMVVGAMISTLCEKGLGDRSKDVRDDGGRSRKVTSFSLTAAGREVWDALLV